MTRLRLTRIFWIGAAATLVVAALIGVAGLLRSEFTETDGQILLTLLTLLVAGGAAVASTAWSSWRRMSRSRAFRLRHRRRASISCFAARRAPRRSPAVVEVGHGPERAG